VPWSPGDGHAAAAPRGWQGGMVPGAAGDPQPMHLPLGLFWSPSIFILFRGPQLEEDSCVQSSPLVVPDCSSVESHSQICWFPTKPSSFLILTEHIGKLFCPPLIFLARIVAKSIYPLALETSPVLQGSKWLWPACFSV